MEAGAGWIKTRADERAYGVQATGFGKRLTHLSPGL